jgi:acyl carrier protein
MDDKFQEFDTYDSLASVVISSEIEDVFKFKLDSDRLNQMETIEEIVNLIKNNV